MTKKNTSKKNATSKTGQSSDTEQIERDNIAKMNRLDAEINDAFDDFEKKFHSREGKRVWKKARRKFDSLMAEFNALKDATDHAAFDSRTWEYYYTGKNGNIRRVIVTLKLEQIVEVEADTDEEAKDKALAMAYNNEIDMSADAVEEPYSAKIA